MVLLLVTKDMVIAISEVQPQVKQLYFSPGSVYS